MTSLGKTGVERQGIAAFLDGVAPPQRQAEARSLVRIFSEVTGYEPVVHTGGMVGFGRYAYTYDSGHSGVSLATGFAPRKAEISVYVMAGFEDLGPLLTRLGPHRVGKACLYIKHLDRVDETVLRDLIAAGLEAVRARWGVSPD